MGLYLSRVCVECCIDSTGTCTGTCRCLDLVHLDLDLMQLRAPTGPDRPGLHVCRSVLEWRALQGPLMRACNMQRVRACTSIFGYR